MNCIQKMEQIPGKLSLHNGKKKTLILNDAANSNVNGFISAVKTLHNFHQNSNPNFSFLAPPNFH